MKKFISLFLGIIILSSCGTVFATNEWVTDVSGRISWIGAGDADEDIVIEVIGSRNPPDPVYGDSEAFYFTCLADSALVPILTLAYQTQSTCHIATSDPLFGSTATLTMDTAYLSSSDLSVPATSDDITAIQSGITTINSYVLNIYRLVRRIYLRVIFGI